MEKISLLLVVLLFGQLFSCKDSGGLPSVKIAQQVAEPEISVAQLKKRLESQGFQTFRIYR